MAKQIPWYERRAGQFDKRSWMDVRDWWLRYIPTLNPPGGPPAGEIRDMVQLHAQLSNVTQNSPFYIDEITGLREGVLSESLYFIHKAAHVLGGAEVHFDLGACSWSLMSGYQAAFFAIKGILGLLGITYAEHGGATYVIDIWSIKKIKPPKGVLLAHPCEIQIQTCAKMEHKPLWHWFLRMLRITTVPTDIWPQGCVDAFNNLNTSDFGSQRNSMQYYASYWPFNDLHSYAIRNGFGLREAGMDNGVCLQDPEVQDFSIVLAIVTVRFATQLVKSLAQKSNIVKAEWDVLHQSIQGDSHSTFRTAYADLQLVAV